jgi:peptidoglycan/LPS O-acetylase OafA/YrhL
LISRASVTPVGSYRPDIDGLRAIAVLAVIGFHAIPGTFHGGFVGVDVFFVISGFLISGIIFRDVEEKRFSFGRFYQRRIKRIFPALIAVLIASWAIGWSALLLDDYKSLGKHIAGAAIFVPNFLLWSESGYFDTDAIRKPLLHLWSLGVEEQYYLIWPLLTLLFWRTSRTFALLISVIFLGSFALNAGGVRDFPYATFYLPFARFWELMLGGFLALINLHWSTKYEIFLGRTIPIHHGRRLAINDLAACVGLTLVLATTFLLNKNNLFPGWWALLPTIGAFFLIAAGPGAFINRKILAHPILVFVGLISYPLYLWHWPLLSFAKIIEGYPTKPMTFAAVASAFVLAWLTYRWIETPIRTGQPKNAMVQFYPWVLIVLMASVGVLGVVTYQKDGFADRVSPEISAILKQPYDVQRAYRSGDCFFNPASGSHFVFADKCAGTGPSDQPLVFIWGDSHGAHLYPGLKYLRDADADFGLAQFTGCAPVPEVRRRKPGHCPQINVQVRAAITKLKPALVILGARWSLVRPGLHAALQKNIDFLREQGVKEIFLVGPPPIWKPDLKTAVFYFYVRHHTVPSRMKEGLENFESTRSMDIELSQISRDLGIHYVSALDKLCNDDGCIVKVGPATDALISADQDHYSEKGSIYFVRSFSDELNEALKRLKKH